MINVLTFAEALRTGFHWNMFLLEPLMFILWSYVAVALLFWGRGVFCGWLCPFGALQELSSKLARRLKVPQLRVPFAVHERMWPIKYIVFLGLFALSLGPMALAIRLCRGRAVQDRDRAAVRSRLAVRGLSRWLSSGSACSSSGRSAVTSARSARRSRSRPRSASSSG